MQGVYAFCKINTISAWSWPTISLARHIPDRQNPDESFQPFEPRVCDLQYLNPVQFASFVKDIENFGREHFCMDFSRAWGVQWLQDGVRCVAFETEFHSVRYVDFESGELRHAFVSFEEKNDVGSVGPS